jgi:hypothetical protein
MKVFTSRAAARRMGRPAATLLIAMIVAGATATPLFAGASGAQDKPPSSDSYDVGRPYLARRGDALVLVHLAAARPDAAPTDKATAVPDGVFEGLESAPPVTFKPTWYRRVDRGFAMRAYENSGDLTIATEELLFVDGRKTVRIPYARLQSVRWEPMPNDIANHWVIVRFTNDEGKADGVGFRDGGRLGNRQGTGKIYQAVRRAAKK